MINISYIEIGVYVTLIILLPLLLNKLLNNLNESGVDGLIKLLTSPYFILPCFLLGGWFCLGVMGYGYYDLPLGNESVQETITLVDSTKGKVYEKEFKTEIEPILKKDKLTRADQFRIYTIQKRYESEELKKELVNIVKEDN